MNTQLKDVIHFYLGAKTKGVDGGMIYTLSGIDRKGNAMFYDGFGNEIWLSPGWKLLLRRLESMTEEENKELLIKRFYGNEDILLQTVDTFKFYPDEAKRRIKRGRGVAFTLLKGSKHVMTGTLIYNQLSPAQFQYLLSRGFDLFSLIESGQAIDATTLNK